MKIIDCITYFNEPLLFELRLNILDKFVDEFVVSEATFTHSGKKKNINFDISRYEKFKHKIKHQLSLKNLTTFLKLMRRINQIIHFIG